MKKYLIAMAVTAISIVAIADTKARIEELEEISANTPSQVEMKKDAPTSTGAGIQQKTNNVQTQNHIDNQKFDNMINSTGKYPSTSPPQKRNSRSNIPTIPQMP